MADEYLWVATSEAAGTALEVGGEGLVVGRDPETDLPLDDPRVSRRHARFLRTPEGLAVEDLGSTNGTEVNDGRLTGRRGLRAGDRVAIGACVIEVRSRVPATEIAASPTAPPPVAAASAPPPPAPASPAPAPPAPAPPAPAPAGAPPPLAAPPGEPHGYPEPGRAVAPAPAPAPPPPAHRAAKWGEVPGSRGRDEGLRALKGDAHVRFRAYLATVVVLLLVALAVVLFLVTR